MIKRCFLQDAEQQAFFELSCNTQGQEAHISLSEKIKGEVSALSFCIEFDQPVKAYRDVTYQWCDIAQGGEYVANEHSPKVLVLADGTHVVSTRNIGLWSLGGSNNTLLTWVLNDIQLTPLFQFDHKGAHRFTQTFTTDSYQLGLLFSKDEVPEFSRSAIPFTPIVCFTDHCDFDTEADLNKQLAFFKEHGITVTKGFFLHHYSKRADNASYEREPGPVTAFKAAGHELAYHSLTQSLRSKEAAREEFSSFRSPVEPPVNTWIDHGKQPYNYTKLHSSGFSPAQWADNLSAKGIRHLWNYLDAGQARKGCLNQLNPQHFTIARLQAHNKTGLFFLFRTILFYHGGEKEIETYKSISGRIKQVLQKKKARLIPRLLKDLFSTLGYVMSFLVNHKKRHQPFRWARFAPYIFTHKVGDKLFYFFQTTEVTDFESVFSPENIDLLIREKGAITVHCYFSSPLSYQQGRLFAGGKVSEKNKENIAYLGKKISNRELWNPTLSELIAHYKKVLEMEYFLDPADNKIKARNSELPIRYIRHV
ncbi:hypothetical protein AB9P05_05370 [Roseivirga sp. BDSF3-8]|uniref:hypothetical protein n=1 Tax=Roseivirga sp. BDSF3-8 TaxID=3241598 RepID=UPI003531F4AE